MKFISLFSGIGGFDKALENAGMECDTVVEIDRDARNELRRHFPHARMINDVRKVGLKTHERRSIDVICGGFPCQDVSVAGKRAGFAGERTSLWREFARIIDELEPAWVVPENVPGLFSSWSPVEKAPHPVEVRDFSTKEEAEEWARSMACDWQVEESSDFEEIVSFFQQRGYGLAWRTLDSQYFGVPQRRRRIFLVASLGSGRCAEVLFERECLPWNFATGGETGEVTSTLFASGTGTSRPAGTASEAGFLVPEVTPPVARKGGVGHSPTLNKNKTDLDFLVTFDWQSGGDVRQNISDKPMLQAGQVPAITAFDQSMSETNRSKIEVGTPTPTLKNGDRLSIFMAGQGSKAGSVAASESLSPTLKGSESGLNRVPSVALSLTASPTASGRLDPSGETFVADIAPTLDASYYEKRGSDQQFIAQSGDREPVTTGGVRRLTPTECERLQGFEDGWTAWGIDENGKRVEQSDSARYKQCGNAVSIPPVEWIARRIKEIHDRENG